MTLQTRCPGSLLPADLAPSSQQYPSFFTWMGSRVILLGFKSNPKQMQPWTATKQSTEVFNTSHRSQLHHLRSFIPKFPHSSEGENSFPVRSRGEWNLFPGIYIFFFNTAFFINQTAHSQNAGDKPSVTRWDKPLTCHCATGTEPAAGHKPGVWQFLQGPKNKHRFLSCRF